MNFIPKVQIVKEEVEEQPFNVEPEETREEPVEEEAADEVMDDLIEQVKEVEDTPPSPMASIDNIFEDPPSLTKSGRPRKKRKPLTEEHKAKLAQARLKATAARRRKAAEKKEMKDMEKKEKELLKKQKLKKLNELEKSLGETPSEIKVEKPVEEAVAQPMPVVEEKPVEEKPIVVEKPKTPQSLFSQADLDAAVMNGIMGYEKVRKERKAKKKQEEAKAQEQEKVKQTLINAIAPKKVYNPYAGICY